MQQTTRKAVRYYIDREADTPVIRSVPVARATTPVVVATVTPDDASQERSAARGRLSRLMPLSVRRHRRTVS